MTTDVPTWTHQWINPGKYTFARDFHEVEFGVNDEPGAHGYLTFQDGPVSEHGLNGTTNEEVIAALCERLEALNQPPYQSGFNDRAIDHLRSALVELQERTKHRTSRGVEGTSTP